MADHAKSDPGEPRSEAISVRAPEGPIMSDFPPVAPPDGWRFGRYELLGRLAYGGMAEIYLARESAYGLAIRYVVIKRVLPHIATEKDFVQLFMDEARVAMSLTHPHICHIYELGRVEGSYFLAMEWVNGVSLNKLLRKLRAAGERLPVPLSARIVAQIAEALDYAHGVKDEHGEPLGIVHRDVTPHNIMVSFDGAVKLLDFGIAKASSRGTHTQTGVVRGKFAYMSPQHCVGQAIDGRADVFSLGVCLYECLTGKRLYRRETDFETCQAILEEPVPSIREVDAALPEALDAVVQRALAKDPDDRFATAGEMQAALEQFLAERREVVSAQQLGELLRARFADEYESGPDLDVSTELLQSLTRVSEQAASAAGPTVRPQKKAPDSQAGTAPATEPAPERVELTGTQMAPAGGRSSLGLLFLSLFLAVLALGMGGVAVWALLTRQGIAVPGILGPTAAPGTPTAAAGAADASTAEPTAPTGPAPVGDPRMGAAWISSEPAGADIYINSNPTGLVTPAQIPGLWPGNYRITLRKAGRQTYRTRVHVEAGEVVTASGTLPGLGEAPPARRGAEAYGEEEDDPPLPPPAPGTVPQFTPEPDEPAAEEAPEPTGAPVPSEALPALPPGL